MIKTCRLLIVSALVVVLLVGCQEQQVEPLPTLMPTPDPATETPFPTEAPTPTPLQRPTLPPTWTPSPAPTETEASVQVVPPVNPIELPAGQATLEVCGVFRADRSRYDPAFRLGGDATVAWMPVSTAVGYRVAVVDEFDLELFVDYTAETTFTFQADLFERNKRYGWSVYPIDGLGQQMCISVGGQLFPQ